MALHPIEYRYYTKEMREIFSEKNILQKKLDVEAALARAHAQLGNIPKKAAEEISKKANTNEIFLDRVKDIEKNIGHDIMAIVQALSEKCPTAGKYVHLGATSYDIVDTSWALILREALESIEKDLEIFKKILLENTKKYKELVMVGRTHGQHAIPTTLGLKFAVWACEIQRHLERVFESKKIISVGKMTGAVGTGASFGKNAVKIQNLVMKELKLNTPLATTQVLQRDRHAQVIFNLILISMTLEKVAKEIRNLQRTEIQELEEPFKSEQVGSSTMPQKRNPHRSERVCGIARYLRSNIIPALENIPLEHERDLTGSSCERIIFPETFTLLHYILDEMISIIEGLKVYPKNIEKNLKITQGRVMAESVMQKLIEKGLGRQEAHELIRVCSMESFEKNIDFASVLINNKKVREYLSIKDIEESLKPENYLGASKEIIDNVLKKLS